MTHKVVLELLIYNKKTKSTARREATCPSFIGFWGIRQLLPRNSGEEGKEGDGGAKGNTGSRSHCRRDRVRERAGWLRKNDNFSPP